MVTYEGAAVELVRAVAVCRAGGAAGQLLLDAGQVCLGRVHVVTLLLVLKQNNTYLVCAYKDTISLTLATINSLIFSSSLKSMG